MSWTRAPSSVVKRTRHPHSRHPSPWARLVPTSDWFTSRGKKGSQSSMLLLTWLADWLRWVNPNLLSSGCQGAEWYVALVLTPQITCSQPHGSRRPPNIGCDARQMHLPSPWQPGGKPPAATNMNLAYSQVYASTNCSCQGSATRKHQIGLLWNRLSQFVNLGLLFSAAVRERRTGACTKLST